MANQEHLNIIQMGSREWNHWRIENQKEKPNLSGVNLTGKDLTGINFFNTELYEANLGWTLLTNANLMEANLGWADLTGADLTKTNLTRSFLSGTIFQKSIMNNTIIVQTDLSAAQNIETIYHHGPSSVSIDTLQLTALGISTRPQGIYPAGQQRRRWSVVGKDNAIRFLKGAGLPETIIELFRKWYEDPNQWV